MKKLSVTRVVNELEGSAFFPTKREVDKAGAEDTPVPLVPPVLPVPPVKRVMKQRHPFDIYQDQYEALQKLALEERKQGGFGSMSAMVREAIDKLIAEKRGK
jgi:hypothetical protein